MMAFALEFAFNAVGMSFHMLKKVSAKLLKALGMCKISNFFECRDIQF